MSLPSVTVITVCRNAARVIPDTLRSVAEQTYPALEYIIIDGASTDGTADLCRTAAAGMSGRQGRSVIIVSEPDGGVYEAMNKGVARATGDWVCFMNAGDSFTSADAVYRLFRAASRDLERVEVLYGNAVLVKDFGRVPLKPKPIGSLAERMAFCHQAAFTRLETLRAMPFRTAFRIAADYDFFFRLWQSRGEEAFLYCDEDVAAFEAEEGMSSRDPLAHVREYARIRGVDGRLAWRVWYVGKALRVHLKAALQRLLPERLVQTIRRRNYERLRRRRLGASQPDTGAGGVQSLSPRDSRS
ncbi:MAG: glycosyltransferase [Alloprevotella sp.]|nr:glycosyltransferase [Alloprevotella sp.]